LAEADDLEPAVADRLSAVASTDPSYTTSTDSTLEDPAIAVKSSMVRKGLGRDAIAGCRRPEVGCRHPPVAITARTALGVTRVTRVKSREVV
jgi:hypothetical protein